MHPPFSWEIKRFFCRKKVPLDYAPPGQRSDVPSIMLAQTYLGGLHGFFGLWNGFEPFAVDLG